MSKRKREREREREREIAAGNKKRYNEGECEAKGWREVGRAPYNAGARKSIMRGNPAAGKYKGILQ